MTISKALPIRFWLNGQETFNEKEVPGIDEFLFAQKFNKADSIKLQIIDSSIKAYRIEVLDESDVVISTTLFTRETINDSYVYSITIDFSSLDDGCYHLQIVEISFTVTGVISGLIGEVSGTATNDPSPAMFDLQGDIYGLLGTISGTIEQIIVSEGIFAYANTIAVCDSDNVTLYWLGSDPWEIGTQFFTDNLLTTPLSGYSYLTEVGSGTIHTISGLGVVLADTGIVC